ncbi:MAG: alpha/beta hydrolase [Verrucomicrobiota bacterium]|nr:alpha/beta hydrolase [Verrucomicrobiota bacterium]
MATGFAAGDPPYTRQQDIIYGRKYGMALTLDLFRPKEHANGLGIVFVVSGGWFSVHHPSGHAGRFTYLLNRGYTVFSVVHGSQPKFTIPEILEDLNRAVRFIRFHAKDYGIDPARIGITGGSAGGHLSLMQGTAGDTGNLDAKDPVDRVSSRVQAVACYYPPTDFLNYGKPGEIAIGRGLLWNFSGAFDFKDYDPYWRKLVPITDEERIRKIGRDISPINHVSPEDPPALIIHGDKDWLVPIQQAEAIIARLTATGVQAKLVVKPGADHGWQDKTPDEVQIADWFDEHLKNREAGAGRAGEPQN